MKIVSKTQIRIFFSVSLDKKQIQVLEIASFGIFPKLQDTCSIIHLREEKINLKMKMKKVTSIDNRALIEYMTQMSGERNPKVDLAVS